MARPLTYITLPRATASIDADIASLSCGSQIRDASCPMEGWRAGSDVCSPAVAGEISISYVNPPTNVRGDGFRTVKFAGEREIV
ncbi:hypothetical protein [Halosegnis longus]